MRRKADTCYSGTTKKKRKWYMSKVSLIQSAKKIT